MLIFEGFLILLFLAIAISFVYAGHLAAPWLPTPHGTVKHFLHVAEIKQGDVVFDLGCGDGRIISAAAKQGAEAIGFEISVMPYLLGRIRLLFTHHAKILFKNFWHADFSKANLIYIFLLPKVYPALVKKIQNECKPGTRIISCAWPIETWQPIKISEGKRTIDRFYFYQI
ncbi:MAG TPA: hypothetical protein VFQ60_02105 [Patescibacteria group bacterium]|nr:hypothetical protein [Patescibacteria group bacterium]